jgi:hypothetical protein
VQLDSAGAQLQTAKSNGQGSEETDHLMRENQLLRNILVRERHEEARREDARKLVVAELERLKIKSDALNRGIGVLAQPMTQLSTQELDLLRQPVISVSDNEPAGVTASFIFAKKSAGDPIEGEATNNSNRVKEEGHNNARSVQHATRENFHQASSAADKVIPGNPVQGSE